MSPGACADETTRIVASLLLYSVILSVFLKSELVSNIRIIFTSSGGDSFMVFHTGAGLRTKSTSQSPRPLKLVGSVGHSLIICLRVAFFISSCLPVTSLAVIRLFEFVSSAGTSSSKSPCELAGLVALGPLYCCHRWPFAKYLLAPASLACPDFWA